ncbi:phospholipid-binding protein MlaC [uncultured Methylophaga sp.]|jgi:phospholipid transport system substrate-binding protein|uniref:MlaC/ttg2D family ABC transporter substrate-binding protein n=1 Tax=uncultured Methylophaga sp. TaxID=285271 RepID=UPI0026315830|nr:ABC transporter substrate-binding protein [uncultured Methylophaga sp.]
MTMLVKTMQSIMLALSVMMMSFSPAGAEEMPAPQAQVKQASDKMLAALAENKTELETNPDKIYELVEDILMPHFDFEKMSKLALGKNWRSADDKQQARFVDEFRLLLIRTYSTAMLEYTDEEIRFLPFRDDLSRKRVSVPMEVVQPAGPSIPMSLSLYQNKGGDWKVYDVKIDGISLVTNYRSSFANEIRKGGMDKLIEDLSERNAKIKA